MASKLKLGLGSGLLNFDLIGTFFDFSVASTGKWGDGRSDTWYSSEIQNFWVKGKITEQTGMWYISSISFEI